MWAAGKLLLREIQIILGITLKNRKLQFKDLQLKNKIHKKCYPSKVLCQIEYKTRRVCDEINNNNRNQEKRTWLCPGSPGGKIIVVEKISWWKIAWWKKMSWWKYIYWSRSSFCRMLTENLLWFTSYLLSLRCLLGTSSCATLALLSFWCFMEIFKNLSWVLFFLMFS